MEKLKFLPNFLEAEKLARTKTNITGSLLIPNISEVFDFADSTKEILVTVHLSFSFNEKKHIQIIGGINTNLNSICQRCMQLMHFVVSSDFALIGVDSNEQANNIPDEFEPVVLKNGRLDVSKLVHEEIILNVPIVPYHGVNECTGLQSYQSITKNQKKNSNDVQKLADDNPFAILSTFK